MTAQLKQKAGPVSFAARMKPTTPERTSAPVEPLWTTKELGTYLRKGKNALSEFLNTASDFPAFKIGSEWRADPEEVKAWVRRQRVQAANSRCIQQRDGGRA
jgi:hypothetical protein